ncbi:MAG: hypothetical protein CMJ79_06970 [Planctomycetaceae bacterium]|nr:hypothetical protein [Planctomycetaceae bacterium]|tara:strand:+ start:2072 stop:3457 length:1386 start_codon:yes stop_codon:yes gene_type:complete
MNLYYKIPIILTLVAGVVHAQPEGQSIDLRSYGLNIPPGEMIRSDGQNVKTVDEYGNSVIAKVHVTVGSYHVVLLPDGQLVGRAKGECLKSEEPFVAADKLRLGKNLLETQFRGFKVRKTGRYVYIYNTSEGFAQATSQILEKMAPGILGFMKNLDLEVHEPEVPLVVVMFRTEAEFQRYRKTPAGIVAYYHTLTNRVVMYEESRLTEIKPELAIKQKINTIAHEGVHQLLHNIGVQTRTSQWPMWITEGIAEYLSPTSTGQYMRWKGAGTVNDFRMFELEQFLKTTDLLAGMPGKWTRDTLTAYQLDSRGYASAWVLTHYLAKVRPIQFKGYLQELQKLGPLEGVYRVSAEGTIERHIDLFAKHFQVEPAVLEKQLVPYINKLPYKDPFIEWPHVTVLLRFRAPRGVQMLGNVFHNDEIAEQWLARTLNQLELSKDQVQIQKKVFPTRVLAERYVRASLN